MSTSDPPQSSLPTSDTMRDLTLWRKKTTSLIILLVSTTTWILLQVYQYNFLTVLSWLAMLVVASLFIWGNLIRLLGKEPSELSRLEMREESAIRLAMNLRAWAEEGMKWMFKVGTDYDVFSFALTLGGFWLLSLVANYVDLLNLLYIGIVMGMTVPPIYVRYEENIRSVREKVKREMKRYYEMFNEKVSEKVKRKVVKTTPTTTTTEEKVKKVE